MLLNTITIREKRKSGETFIIAVSFNNGPEYTVSMKDPFDVNVEQLLEWYFEDYLKFPFIDEVKAEKAVEAVNNYGEDLFEQVFGGREVYSEYVKCRESGLSNCEIKIISDSHAFHAIHWESIKDPYVPHPLVTEWVSIVRKNNRPPPMEAKVKTFPQINVLLVTARPDEDEDVNYRTISRPMVELLETSKLRVNVHILRPGTFQALSNHLDDVGEQFYHIIHFDTHGSLASYDALEKARKADKILFQSRWGLTDITPYKGVRAYLYFESDEKGKAVPVEAAELAQLLLTKQVPVCIINACQSAKQISFYETSLGSNLMEAGIQAVLAVSYSITVSAAKMLMETVYEHIFSQHSLPKAVSKGRRHLYKQKGRKAYFDQTIDLEDWLLPVVYQNRPVTFNLRDFTPQEEEAYFEKQEREHTISHIPFYGFFGRDLDIMVIEKRLLNHNMLLLRGMGGTGKTTLLDYLAWWWEKTGFVNKSFYFGYDKTAYTLEQILFVMAKRLFDEQTFAAFQSSGLATQKGKIIDVLKAERFCLIVDNCESITGSPLAVQNTLPDDEQKKLKEFLQKLSGGKSFCVFGSRGDEDWLKKETFKGNVHWLQGLDPEARSDMAMRIVKELSIGFFWDDPAFLRLMALLAGYPLAMEVVLPNLTRLTPAHIIASLRAGDVDLEAHDGKDKTDSILKCVDYSHGNLSLDAQKVLLCLAPFSSVVNVALLPRYIEKLQHFEPFKDWPLHLWEEVIQETVKWGLMEPLYQGMFLRLQPVFPFFLRNKVLQTLDDTGREHLDQAFIAHYDEVAGSVYTLFESKKPEERQIAKVLAEQEYENIFTALEMCLERQKSIFYTYFCLSSYIDVTQDHKRGLRLGKMVLKTLEDYPVDLLEGELGVELAGVIDDVGKRFLLTKQLKQAENSYVKALKIFQNVTGLKKEQKAVVIASIYHQLGRVAQELREFDEARKNYQKALEIYSEFKDQYAQAKTYHHLGRVAQELREFDEARKNYQKALEIKIEFNDQYAQASTYHQLGVVAEELREFDEARKNYQKALEIKIEFNDQYAQASTYHHLGMVAEELREFDEARKNYQKALEISIEFNDQYAQASTYHQLGVVAEELREFDEARKNYQKALEISIEFNDQYAQASTYHHLGMVAEELREFDEARKNYQKALEIKIEFKDQYAQAGTYHQLGRVAEELREFDEARKNYQKALEIFSEFKDQYSLDIVKKSLKRLEEKK